MSYYSQNVFVKIWLLINVILGLMCGSFFAYENFKSCGDFFTAGIVVGFLYTLINLILLGFQQAWRIILHIIIIVILITFAILSFVVVSEVNNQSICDNQWCIGKGIDVQQIIQNVNENVEDQICSDDTKQQSYMLAQSRKQYLKIKKTDIWNIDNSIPLAFSSMQGSMCLLLSILLVADIFKQRKMNRKKETLIQ